MGYSVAYLTDAANRLRVGVAPALALSASTGSVSRATQPVCWTRAGTRRRLRAAASQAGAVNAGERRDDTLEKRWLSEGVAACRAPTSGGGSGHAAWPCENHRRTGSRHGAAPMTDGCSEPGPGGRLQESKHQEAGLALKLLPILR